MYAFKDGRKGTTENAGSKNKLNFASMWKSKKQATTSSLSQEQGCDSNRNIMDSLSNQFYTIFFFSYQLFSSTNIPKLAYKKKLYKNLTYFYGEAILDCSYFIPAFKKNIKVYRKTQRIPVTGGKQQTKKLAETQRIPVTIIKTQWIFHYHDLAHGNEACYLKFYLGMVEGYTFHLPSVLGYQNLHCRPIGVITVTMVSLFLYLLYSIFYLILCTSALLATKHVQFLCFSFWIENDIKTAPITLTIYSSSSSI